MYKYYCNQDFNILILTLLPVLLCASAQPKYMGQCLPEILIIISPKLTPVCLHPPGKNKNTGTKILCHPILELSHSVFSRYSYGINLKLLVFEL